MATCVICLGILEKGSEHHERCLKNLFGTNKPPSVDIDTAQMHTIGAAMAGHSSISGVQKKISAGLNIDRTTLQAVIKGGHYILKPQSEVYPQLPETELVSMRLAELAQVHVASGGLVRLKDESIAYISRRFDRPEAGGKLRMEDFCQLAGLPPKEKYETSAENCVRIVKKYCDEPLIETRKLFRQLLVAWWIGNGDLHLKNLSLLVQDDGLIRLSPAYDMMSTEFLIPNDELALPVSGKRKRLSRSSWLDLAEYASLPEKATLRIFDDLLGVKSDAVDMVGRSFLKEEAKEKLMEILSSNAKLIQ